MGQFEELTVFIRIIEAGGISRAAEQLGLAKSAVSRRLSDLETRLGSQLLNRTTRTSSLTEIGQRYYERAIKVVDEVAELNALIVDTHASLDGTINLAAPLSFGLSHLSPAIDDFINQHPSLTINIDFSDRQVNLVKEGLDLAFRISELKSSNLMARKISPIKMLLCASPSYLKKHGFPKTPNDLQNHDLLYYNMTERNSWILIDKNGTQFTVHINAKIVSNNGDFLKEMAIAGHGIISSPTFIIWKAIAAGELLPVLTDYTLPQPNAYAIYPQTRFLPQRTRALIDFLVDRFGDSPYWDQLIK